MSLQKLYQETINQTKCVLKTKVSRNPITINRYIKEIARKYNEYINKIKIIWETLNSEEKVKLWKQIIYLKNKVKECYKRLDIQIEFEKEIFATIVIKEIKTSTFSRIKINHPSTSSMTNLDDSFVSTTDEMEYIDLLKIANGQINRPYLGDPQGLHSFISSIKILEPLATTTELKTLLVNIIKGKIDGTALDYIDQTASTTEEIITSLRTHIKHDNSKVLEGRLRSIRLSNKSREDFAKEVESITDNLRRALIIEGTTVAKANEMTIDRTIDLCCENTNSARVKSVLDSTEFKAPKEVVAKLIVQLDREKNEHQVLSFRSTNRNFNKYNKYHNNYKNNKNFNRNYNRNKYQGNYNNNYRNNNNNNNNFNNRNQNNYNNNYNNNQSRYQNRYNNNNNNNNQRNVRAFGPENSSGPQQQTLGENQN